MEERIHLLNVQVHKKLSRFCLGAREQNIVSVSTVSSLLSLFLSVNHILKTRKETKQKDTT